MSNMPRKCTMQLLYLITYLLFFKHIFPWTCLLIPGYYQHTSTMFVYWQASFVLCCFFHTYSQILHASRNCVILVVRVRTLGSVGSRTELSLRCNFSDYVFRNNYMFRPMVAIFRLSWEYLRATVSDIARIMQRSLHVQLAGV